MLRVVQVMRARVRARSAAALVCFGLVAAVGVPLADAGRQVSGRPQSPPQQAPGDLVVVVDGSGSMGKRDVAPNRMTAAKRAAVAVVRSLPVNTRVGLIAYGTRSSNRDEDRDESCKDIRTLSAVRTLNEDYRASLVDKINGIEPSGFTPIARSMERAVLSLPDRRGTVIIVTDGEETCAPPEGCATARALKDKYPDITVSTVGLTIGLSEQLACIANATGGLFVTADDTSELERRLGVVTSQPTDVTLLTPSGYGPAQLGATYDDLVGVLDGFPALDEGHRVAGLWNLRNLTRLTYDSAYYYFADDQRLVGIQPFRPITVDGVTLGSTSAKVKELYGEPTQVQGRTALYPASRQTAAGYLMTYDGNPARNRSTVAAVILCLCVPRETPTTTTTTTTTLPPVDTVPLTVVLTASGYGPAVLGETYEQLAVKLAGLPSWDESTDHPGLWDLGGLRQLRVGDVTYVFDGDRVLVGVQPDAPLTVDGIDLGATAREVAEIYGSPVDVRGRQGLYPAAVASAAAYLVTYDGGASRSGSKATGIAVCLCGPPPPPTTEPTQPPPTDPPDTTPPPPPPTEPVATDPPVSLPLPPPPEPVPTSPPSTTPPPTEPRATDPPATTPPPETVPPETVPAVTPVLLRADGIGDVTFGTPAADAVAALTALLGPPADDPGLPPDPQKDCGGPRLVTWRFPNGDLQVEITVAPMPPDADPNGVFSGYAVLPATDPAAQPAVPVAFENGIAQGMTWAQWLEVLSDSTIETDGDTGALYGANGGRFFAYFERPEGADPTSEPTPETPIRSIAVGHPACLGA